MAKVKYKFNPQTLKFDVVAISLSKRIAKVLIHFGLSLVVSAVLILAYSFFFDTPKEKILKRESSEYLVRLELLQKKLEHTNSLVSDIEQRDNIIYRAIFEVDSIPMSLREGGFGGSNRYAKFEGLRNSDLLINTAKMLDQLTWKVYIQSKSFDEVIDLAKNKERIIQCMPAIQPVSVKDLVRISDFFGYRRDPFNRSIKYHHGIDFSGPIGAPIYSTGDGVVVECGYSFFGYGNQIVIDHGFGYKTRYAHLHKISVKEGQKVTRGQIIATLGNTGRSTGPHLHYEVLHRGKPVDPLNFFNDITEEEYDRMVSISTAENSVRVRY